MKETKTTVDVAIVTNILLGILIIVWLVIISRISSLKDELESTHNTLSHISSQISQDDDTLFYRIDDLQYSLDDIKDTLNYF